MNFNEAFQKKMDVFEAYLQNAATFPDLSQKTVFDAMRYSLLAGGKRIRPVLAMACCEALGGREEDVLPFAAALECIHTYSLIHDDLPAMDNDDLRRGKPTCHKVYGEAAAILAGDGLLNYAFELCAFCEAPDHRKVAMLKAISAASGVYGMVGGQMVDLESEGRQIDKELLTYMVRLKTGALLSAAASIGAIAAGCAADTFAVFANNLGLAFQIKDDILDFEGDAIKLGKNTGCDQKQQKSTFVTCFGLEAAKQMLADASEKASLALAPLGEKGGFLQGMVAYLLDRDN